MPWVRPGFWRIGQPTQGQLADLALLLLEEVWVAVKAGNIPLRELGDRAQTRSSTGSERASFKRVLDAAHDMRLQTAPALALV